MVASDDGDVGDVARSRRFSLDFTTAPDFSGKATLRNHNLLLPRINAIDAIRAGHR
jgi:hypothetical protein